MSKTCVLLSEKSWGQWGHLLEGSGLPLDFARVQDASTVVFGGRSMAPRDVPAEVAWLTAEAIIGPAMPAFAQALEESPAVKWAHSAGAGYDMAITQNLLKRGVRLTTSHVNAIPIAEYVMRGVLERFQRSDIFRQQREQRVIQRVDFREIHATTWLIYGVGAIGSAVAERARAFGARTIGVRRSPTGREPVDEMIRPAQAAANLGRADVVLISAPYTPETENLVDASFLAAMKKASVLVNVARASMLDEAALVAALDSDHLDFAVLDVHWIEESWMQSKKRVDDSPLWTHPKIELTQHIASGGIGRYERGARLFVDNLRKYLAGQPMPDEVTINGGGKS